MISSSRSRASSSTSSSVVNENLNLQDLEGITVGRAGGDVTVINTDQNAFDRATELAQRSVAAGEALALENQNFLRDILGGVSDFFTGALSFTRETTARHQETISAIAKPPDERIAQTSADAQRNILIALGILAAGAVVVVIYRGR